MAHMEIPLTVERPNGEKIEGSGFVCDCSERGVVINVHSIEDGTPLVNLYFSHEDFKEINK